MFTILSFTLRGNCSELGDYVGVFPFNLGTLKCAKSQNRKDPTCTCATESGLFDLTPKVSDREH